MASREISSPRSKRQLLLMETRLERVRLVYDRWIRWQFSRILRSIESEFNLLDHVPDETEAASIIAGFGSSQLSVLAHAYRGIYPSASELVAPSEGKSFRVDTAGGHQRHGGGHRGPRTAHPVPSGHAHPRDRRHHISEDPSPDPHVPGRQRLPGRAEGDLLGHSPEGHRHRTHRVHRGIERGHGPHRRGPQLRSSRHQDVGDAHARHGQGLS